jgi:hypothetical protein
MTDMPEVSEVTELPTSRNIRVQANLRKYHRSIRVQVETTSVTVGEFKITTNNTFSMENAIFLYNYAMPI